MEVLLGGISKSFFFFFIFHFFSYLTKLTNVFIDSINYSRDTKGGHEVNRPKWHRGVVHAIRKSFVFFCSFLKFWPFFLLKLRACVWRKPSPMSELGLRHLHLGVSSWHSHGYKDMQDMVENVKLDIYGAFLVRFLWFFFCLM